jgi:hypothetical protein
VVENYEDKDNLIQVNKNLSKPAKKEIGKLRETSYSMVVENVLDEC